VKSGAHQGTTARFGERGTAKEFKAVTAADAQVFGLDGENGTKVG
jgi:hypothetical protein